MHLVDTCKSILTTLPALLYHLRWACSAALLHQFPGAGGRKRVSFVQCSGLQKVSCLTYPSL